MKTYEEAEDYAIALRENCSIMLNPKTNEYHVIRASWVEHWERHYTEVATVKMLPVVEKVRR